MCCCFFFVLSLDNKWSEAAVCIDAPIIYSKIESCIWQHINKYWAGFYIHAELFTTRRNLPCLFVLSLTANKVLRLAHLFNLVQHPCSQLYYSESTIRFICTVKLFISKCSLYVAPLKKRRLKTCDHKFYFVVLKNSPNSVRPKT